MSKPKTVVLIDNPYSPPEWPKIEPGPANDLLDLLATVISPIADHRESLPRSAGKRKRRSAAKEKHASETEQPTAPGPTAPPPAISRYVVAGVNSTTATLEAAVAHDVGSISDDSAEPPIQAPVHRLRAVFVCRADGHPTQLHAHLPALCQLTKPPVKLLALPKGAEPRLTDALGIPRLGVVGLIDGAPGADILWELIDGLPTVDVPWVKEKSEWQPPRIKQLQTKPGAKKPTKKKQDPEASAGEGNQAKRQKSIKS